jgi:uncharacterized protein YndB with AHSA1/START domain
MIRPSNPAGRECVSEQHGGTQVLRTFLTIVAGSALLAAVAPARAEVIQVSADSLVVRHTHQIAATPGKVYAAIGQIGQWWAKDHTWSGSSANLSLELRPGGCFCERWGSAGAEHGHVVMLIPNELVRIAAQLGPMQELAVTGALTFQLAPKDGGTELTVSYRMSGDSQHKFEALAPIVDGVIGLQARGLAEFAAKR